MGFKINIQRFGDYDVNYEDERLKSVNSEKTQKISESNQLYDSMINQSDQFYQKQSELAQNYANKQTELQKASTNQTINEINQAKDKTYKDYEKEQRGAYTDYQKAINPYGVNAENIASQGLQNSGYAESSRISAFNTYQSRYSVARESYISAVQNYDNQMIKARQNLDTNLAEIAYNALKSQLESALTGFQAKNELLLQKANKSTEIDNTYYGRWQDVLAQINSENQFRYQQDQDTKNFEYKKEQDRIANELAEKQYQLSVAQFNASRSSSGSRSGSSKKSSTKKLNSINVNNNETTTNSSNNNSVSNNAKLLYQQLSEQKVGSIDGTTENLSNTISDNVNKGIISDSDASWLFNKLKL